MRDRCRSLLYHRQGSSKSNILFQAFSTVGRFEHGWAGRKRAFGGGKHGCKAKTGDH